MNSINAVGSPGTYVSGSDIKIVRGHGSSVIDSAVRMQSQYYTRTPGFNSDYKTQLASGLPRLESRMSDGRTDVWTARIAQDDRIVGTIFVDGGDVDQVHARLTSFIVDDGFRGVGTGRRLLTAAIEFIDEREFTESRLWTFEGSDAARRLYESVGFVLKEQSTGEYFGKQLVVQLFVRKTPI